MLIPSPLPDQDDCFWDRANSYFARIGQIRAFYGGQMSRASPLFNTYKLLTIEVLNPPRRQGHCDARGPLYSLCVPENSHR